MSKGLVDSLLNEIFDSKWLGKRGESLSARELKWVNLFGRKGNILRNLYVPKGNGDTSEIDVIYLTQKGIFVLESKNYSGWIFGTESDTYWTVRLPGQQNNRFYNPIKQNQTHLKWLGTFVGDHVPLFSIIVFSERCELKKVQVDSSDIAVVKRDRIYATIRSIWEKSPDILSEEEIISLTEKLQPLTLASEKTKQEHIYSIEERFGKKGTLSKSFSTQKSPIDTSRETLVTVETSIDAPAKSTVTEPESLIESTDILMREPVQAETLSSVCPRCGSPLVLRTAVKGVNAGNQFWGCSAFPKCRFIKSFTP